MNTFWGITVWAAIAVMAANTAAVTFRIISDREIIARQEQLMVELKTLQGE